mmetsp:Transcript_24788/g.81463  ORF Transcript_24788/g.81463 Transcript_24788/m.81463 type:complete len:122 (-) Transcript_24788:1617-1982(-)
MIGDGFYEGEFVNGEISGSGVRQWADGSTYTGQFLNGEHHGQGLFLHSNGDRYEGGFLNNQRSGHGVLVLADGASTISAMLLCANEVTGRLSVRGKLRGAQVERNGDYGAQQRRPLRGRLV